MRNFPDYVIQNDITNSPPGNNVWVVYSINIGGKKYIGLSVHFAKRMRDHLSNIKKFLALSNLPSFVAANYGKFCPNEIRRYNIRFEIEAYCEDRDECRRIERSMIIQAAKDGAELNSHVPPYHKIIPRKEVAPADCIYILGVRIPISPQI